MMLIHGTLGPEDGFSLALNIVKMMFCPSQFNEKDFIITTEKDYMRLKGKVNKLYYIAIQHKFIGDGKEKVVKAIADFIS